MEGIQAANYVHLSKWMSLTLENKQLALDLSYTAAELLRDVLGGRCRNEVDRTIKVLEEDGGRLVLAVLVDIIKGIHISQANEGKTMAVLRSVQPPAIIFFDQLTTKEGNGLQPDVHTLAEMLSAIKNHVDNLFTLGLVGDKSTMVRWLMKEAVTKYCDPNCELIRLLDRKYEHQLGGRTDRIDRFHHVMINSLATGEFMIYTTESDHVHGHAFRMVNPTYDGDATPSSDYPVGPNSISPTQTHKVMQLGYGPDENKLLRQAIADGEDNMDDNEVEEQQDRIRARIDALRTTDGSVLTVHEIPTREITTSCHQAIQAMQSAGRQQEFPGVAHANVRQPHSSLMRSIWFLSDIWLENDEEHPYNQHNPLALQVVRRPVLHRDDTNLVSRTMETGCADLMTFIQEYNVYGPKVVMGMEKQQDVADRVARTIEFPPEDQECPYTMLFRTKNSRNTTRFAIECPETEWWEETITGLDNPLVNANRDSIKEAGKKYKKRLTPFFSAYEQSPSQAHPSITPAFINSLRTVNTQDTSAMKKIVDTFRGSKGGKGGKGGKGKRKNPTANDSVCRNCTANKCSGDSASCPAKDSQCNKCKKTGHWAAKCRSKKKPKSAETANAVATESTADADEDRASVSSDGDEQ